MIRDKNKALNKIVKVLKGLDIVLGIIIVIALLAVIALGIISRISGVTYIFGISGNSMFPTIQTNALVALEETPFDELQVGDIIIFRQRIDTGSKITFSDEDLQSGVAQKSFNLKDSPEESYKDEGISYKDGNYTIHRIIEIREADESGDRAIFTRGDNNPVNDRRTVMKSGYVSRVAWHLNYVGLFMRIMFYYKGVYWLLGICAVLTIAVIIIRPRLEETAVSEVKEDAISDHPK